MFLRVPLRYFAYVTFAIALIGLTVVVLKPPFYVAMIFFGVQIAFGALSLARTVAESLRTKA